MASAKYKKVVKYGWTLTLHSVLLIIANMSDQCTVSSDGSLKDAADIQWYNDADNAVPISSASRSLASTSASLSAQSLDDFFRSRPPAKKVSGERHSSWVRKPSKRTTDPDNAEALGNTFEDAISGQKRKPGTVGISRRVSRKVIQSDSDDDTASNDSDSSDPTDAEAESDEDLDAARTTENYENMKALGDKDREVTAFYLMNEFLLNLACRWPLKSQRLNVLLMLGQSSNAMTIASTLTRGRSKGATGVLCASKLTIIWYHIPY